MAEENSRPEPPKRPWHLLNRADLAILLCGVTAALGITFGTPLLQQGQPPAVVNAVAAAPATAEPVPSATPIAAPSSTAPALDPLATGAPWQATPGPALPEAAAPVRISYPAADLDVPVHPLEPDSAAAASQTIVPPETKDAYWLTPYGVPGNHSANTTYVIGHSWDGADAPFNHLSSAAKVGDSFTMETGTGAIPYRVDSVTTYVKASLKDSPIWEIVPNRVVLISCYTEDPWGKNVVVTASPAGP
ncbi:class F sortase [Pseudarthrobacter chlorophenolicus]|uniref:class F sortase n=1 Tax=Pseudarthrobacter chlorophenolicus TaxID=85085 RepID=UPI0005F27CE0|nr:class F sortase [Pseudarthrobacter chlorophenolicus]